MLQPSGTKNNETRNSMIRVRILRTYFAADKVLLLMF